ncbi:MAG: DUF202 domain-containing protein [Planctomycetaceae bacterium]|nr:DUF202 domain-containing protein [Planctomycetaceae bacterium]
MSAQPTKLPEEDPRIRFAAERTLLAWIRTGLALMGLGFVVARFGIFLRELASNHASETPPPTGVSLWTGTGLLVLGVTVTLLAALQHYRFISLWERGIPYRPSRWSLGIVVAALLAVVGIGLAVYLHSI